MVALITPEMESKEFALWQALLERQTGLWLPESRKAFLITALARHLKDKEFSDYDELYSKLDDGSISISDWASLVDSLTVHETCYYRDPDSLRLVANYCRNKALENFEKLNGKPQHFQLWSVGCSTGEEAYTLAIELDKLNLGLEEACGNRVYYGVTGIDISYPSLAVAREGVYAAKQLDDMPLATRNHYFNRLADGYYQIKNQIRQRTCFIQSNVLDLEVESKQQFDVIYCQNLLIYFRNDRKKQVIERLANRLKPGGILVLGHGEVLELNIDKLTRVDTKQCLAYLQQ